jgi:predicted phosphodiesterase
MIKFQQIYSDIVLFLGDIHGEYDIVPNFLKKYEITDAVIIQVGDFGIGYETKHKDEKKLMYLNKRLAIFNSKLFVIRGNHDDPSWFKEYFSLGYVNLLPDYSILNINGFNYLGIGGAVSVDRTDRKPYITGKGVGWWKDEVVNFDEDKIKSLNDIDVVFSHTAPDFAFPQIKTGVEYWTNRDDKLLNDLTTERNMMNKIYKEISLNNNISHWYYGHFHKSNNMKHLNTNFVLLDINEFVEHGKRLF